MGMDTQGLPLVKALMEMSAKSSKVVISLLASQEQEL